MFKIQINKFVHLLSIVLLLISYSFAQETRDWKTFAPNTSEWSIAAPGEMVPDAEAQEFPSTMGSYSYTDATSFYAVIYRDTPKGRVLWGPLKNTHFKRVRKDFIKSNSGELLKDEKFSNGTYTGREVYIKVADGRVMDREGPFKTKYRVQRLRMFFDGRRFYLLLAVLPEKEIDSQSVNNYFNSFVLKQSQIANK
jgi:hypothetical protein